MTVDPVSLLSNDLCKSSIVLLLVVGRRRRNIFVMNYIMLTYDLISA